MRGAEPSLLDLFVYDGEHSALNFSGPFISHSGQPTRQPIELLRKALNTSPPASPPAFTFDPSAYPAAKESVFVVSSAEFPDPEAWMAFCEANVKADLMLATLNQLVAKFVQSATARTAIGGEREQQQSGGYSSGVGGSSSSSSPEIALITAVRKLANADSGVLTACPLTPSEEAELRALCENVASAAAAAVPASSPSRGSVAEDISGAEVARRCEAAHARLRETLVRYQSQQMHRWLARRAQVQPNKPLAISLFACILLTLSPLPPVIVSHLSHSSTPIFIHT